MIKTDRLYALRKLIAELIRWSVRLACIIITAAAPAAAVYEQGFERSLSSDDSLRIFAVTIKYFPPLEKSYTGFGIYIGQGAVITAAHVLGRWAFLANPRVLIAGQELPAKVIKKGAFADTDLALLVVDELYLPLRLRLRRDPLLCKILPKAGRDVVVVYPERTLRSRIISPNAIAPVYRTRFNTLIRDVQGSGSGTFDSETKCLLGIMSASVPTYGYRQNGRAGYFVPARKIADFVPQFR